MFLTKIGLQLGNAVGITVSTVVFRSVGSKIRPGEDTLLMYRAALWTCFAFGIIEIILVIVFFRGVGVVGHRAPKPTSVSETEKGESLNSIPGERKGYGDDANDQESVMKPERKAEGLEATPAKRAAIVVDSHSDSSMGWRPSCDD